MNENERGSSRSSSAPLEPISKFGAYPRFCPLGDISSPPPNVREGAQSHVVGSWRGGRGVISVRTDDDGTDGLSASRRGGAGAGAGGGTEGGRYRDSRKSVVGRRRRTPPPNPPPPNNHHHHHRRSPIHHHHRHRSSSATRFPSEMEREVAPVAYGGRGGGGVRRWHLRQTTSNATMTIFSPPCLPFHHLYDSKKYYSMMMYCTLLLLPTSREIPA